MAEEQKTVNRMEVSIHGDRYVIKSDRSEEEMDRVVCFVNQQIQQVDRTDLRFNKKMQITLALLNVTDLLFAKEEALNQSQKKAHSLVQSLETSEKERKTLSEQIENQKAAAVDQEADLVALRENLKAAEEKILHLSKQFQEYRRSHR